MDKGFQKKQQQGAASNRVNNNLKNQNRTGDKGIEKTSREEGEEEDREKVESGANANQK